MRKLKQVWLLTALVITLGSITCCQKQNNDIDLRLKLEKGKTYTLRLSSEQVITQTPPGAIQQTDKLMSMGFIFHVEDLDRRGDALTTVTVHSAKIRLDQGGERMEYDSTVQSAGNMSPEAQGIAAFIGEHFTARITPRGTVAQIEGIDDMLDNVVEKMHYQEGAEKAAAKESLRGEFGSGALKEMLENMLAIYPDHAISVGRSWSDVSHVSGGLPLVLNNTWTLTSLDGDRAVIDVQSEGKPYGDNNLSADEKFFYDLQGTQKGTFVLDAASGWILEATLTQRLGGRVLLNGASQIGENISWPLEIESTTTLEPVE